MMIDNLDRLRLPNDVSSIHHIGIAVKLCWNILENFVTTVGASACLPGAYGLTLHNEWHKELLEGFFVWISSGGQGADTGCVLVGGVG